MVTSPFCLVNTKT